jgi:hypothetical protein
MISLLSLTHAYHAALNAFDLRKVESMFAQAATYSTPTHQSKIMGRDGIIAMMRKYFEEYTDQISQDEKIEMIDDRTVWSKWSLIATSTLSGHKIIRKGTETIKFNGDGLIQSIEVKDQ